MENRSFENPLPLHLRGLSVVHILVDQRTARTASSPLESCSYSKPPRRALYSHDPNTFALGITAFGNFPPMGFAGSQRPLLTAMWVISLQSHCPNDLSWSSALLYSVKDSKAIHYRQKGFAKSSRFKFFRKLDFLNNYTTYLVTAMHCH